MASFKPRYTKVVQSGDLIEVYEYEKAPTNKRFFVTKKRRKRYKGYKSERHIKRAVFTFRRKVRATQMLGKPHMFALTMVEITDIATAYKLFTEFGVRLRKVFGKNVVWIAVPEFQKRGAVHFHALIWNLPYETEQSERNGRRIQHLWGYGYADCIHTDGSTALSGYLAKYMSKAMHDERLFGKKAYSCSRNALSSVSLNGQASVALFKEDFQIDTDNSDMKPTREREYESKWMGKVRYRAYEGTINKDL
jgi:hypothetical protein